MTEEKEAKNSNKLFKLFAPILGVVAVIGLVYFISTNFAFSVGNQDKLDELTEMDKELNTKIEEIFMSEDMSKEDATRLYKDMKKFNRLFRKEAKAFVSLAKKVKVDDREDMKDFLEREKKIMEIAVSEDDCRGGRIIILAYLEETDLSDGNKDRVMDIYNESCDISRLLDVVEVKRETESAGLFSFKEIPKNMADEYSEYDEEENKNIPVGYNIVSLEPDKGFAEEVELFVDGKNKGKSKVVTAEPSKGKRVKGTGDSGDVAREGEKILAEILESWENQKMSAADVLPFLSDENQNKAQEIESNYKKILFNWKRFEKYEPMLNQVTFNENKSDKNYPFVMNLPIIVEGVESDPPKSVSFYYGAKEDRWVADYSTFNALFIIVDAQLISSKASPDKFNYISSDTCKKRLSFNPNDENIIDYFGISGDARIVFGKYISAGESWDIGVEGYDNDITTTYDIEMPLTMLEYINRDRKSVV